MTALYVQESVGTKLPESTRSRAQHTRVSNVYGELRFFFGGMPCDVCLVPAHARLSCLTFAVCALADAKQLQMYMILFHTFEAQRGVLRGLFYYNKLSVPLRAGCSEHH
jgi:hypothetical protein